MAGAAALNCGMNLKILHSMSGYVRHTLDGRWIRSPVLFRIGGGVFSIETRSLATSGIGFWKTMLTACNCMAIFLVLVYP
ncbi:MAG: hypothetical protein HXY42_07255 [Chloroflexi bacterium]|nr:hypothetical protein [Chloroflexota bacterium]